MVNSQRRYLGELFTGKYLKTIFGTARKYRDGYYQITSKKEGNYRKFLHRLIWETNYGKSVPEDYVIHHIDRNKQNNEINNLQCVKREIHSRYHIKRRKHKKISKKKMSENAKGEKNNNSKLTKNDVIKIKKLLNENETTNTKIAEIFGVTQSTISDIKRGVSWTNINIRDDINVKIEG